MIGWIVLLYSLAGGCAFGAAIMTFVEIAQAAKLAVDLDEDPYAGSWFHHMLDTDRDTGARKSQIARVPTIVLRMLGRRRQRYMIGTMVLIGVAAGTTADILAAFEH